MEKKIELNYMDNTFEISSNFRFRKEAEESILFINLDIKKCYVFGEMNKNMPVIKILDNAPKMQISNSGHFMMIDNPQEFYQKLSNIL